MDCPIGKSTFLVKSLFAMVKTAKGAPSIAGKNWAGFFVPD
jgi:hypothetical protein